MKNIVITSCLLMSMHCFANAPVPQNHATNAPSVKNIQDFKEIKGMTNDASRY
ncbi:MULTISPECIES: hypothetical protein [unclassified Acinetobacter]|nr:MULTISPECIES: hypothetical protein [unclassified Acinetobacter]UUS56723.1 hypothetical protein MST16_11615 [Acinetobacter sp. YH16040_T]